MCVCVCVGVVYLFLCERRRLVGLCVCVIDGGIVYMFSCERLFLCVCVCVCVLPCSNLGNEGIHTQPGVALGGREKGRERGRDRRMHFVK